MAAACAARKHATGDYIFFLDADEEITPALQTAIQDAVRSGERAVWKIEWSVVAYGKELTWFLSQSSLERLFRRDMVVRATCSMRALRPAMAR